MKSLRGRRFDTGAAVCIQLGDGVVSSVEDIAENRAQQQSSSNQTLALEPILAPGLFDLQVNGYGGREFSSADLNVEDVSRIAAAIARQGVARFLPTVTTAAVPVMEHALATIAAAMKKDKPAEDQPRGARIEGIHLEGPFLSAEDGPRGAHPRQHCQPPAWDLFQQLQQAAAGKIRLLTMAVEFPGAAKFIRQVTDSGVVVAIGHTAANHQQLEAAVDAGAQLSTHLGNGAHPVLPRHPNYIWSQLAEDRLWTSLIADGFHLPPEVLKAIVRCKSPERCVLISDLSGYAGMPPGRYQTSLCELELLESGKLVVAGQETLLAAASMPLTKGIANTARATDASRAQAIAMASTLPAALLRERGDFLSVGSRADFTLLSWPDEETAEISVAGTIVDGEAVFVAGS